MKKTLPVIAFGAALALMVLAAAPLTRPSGELRVGSKKFTESVILGDMVSILLRAEGFRVAHRAELGGTRFLWSALLAGSIDVYPEYTGTIREEIFSGQGLKTDSQIRKALEQRGIRMTRPLGFDDTYAIGMRESEAAQLGIRTISDLAKHPSMKFGFSNEFMDRKDGWPGLRARYHLPQRQVQGLDHDLAYRGLDAGSINATDLYSTDAEIKRYHIRVLEDDLRYFPAYQAVLLYRAELERSAPGAVKALSGIEGAITAPAMIEMNARAELNKEPEASVAANFLERRLTIAANADMQGLASRLARRTGEHLYLVSLSLLAAILVSIPLGIVAARSPRLGQTILGAAGVIQTVPSLALLVFMIPILGIGALPAMVALFLYSLLPIIRNTFAGLRDISPPIVESAQALGLPSIARLRLVELPIASRAILAGIKTSAVINVGTATLGALIGAGGYGQPILTGIRLDNTALILEGAIPAALLALAVQGMFEIAERIVTPRGLLLNAEA